MNFREGMHVYSQSSLTGESHDEPHMQFLLNDDDISKTVTASIDLSNTFI
jgi:hypothetical protein